MSPGIATYFCCLFCLRADVLWISQWVLMPHEASGSNHAHEERWKATAHQSGGWNYAMQWQLQKKRKRKALILILQPIALPLPRWELHIWSAKCERSGNFYDVPNRRHGKRANGKCQSFRITSRFSVARAKGIRNTGVCPDCFGTCEREEVKGKFSSTATKKKKAL